MRLKKHKEKNIYISKLKWCGIAIVRSSCTTIFASMTSVHQGFAGVFLSRLGLYITWTNRVYLIHWIFRFLSIYKLIYCQRKNAYFILCAEYWTIEARFFQQGFLVDSWFSMKFWALNAELTINPWWKNQAKGLWLLQCSGCVLITNHSF